MAKRTRVSTEAMLPESKVDPDPPSSKRLPQETATRRSRGRATVRRPAVRRQPAPPDRKASRPHAGSIAPDGKSESHLSSREPPRRPPTAARWRIPTQSTAPKRATGAKKCGNAHSPQVIRISSSDGCQPATESRRNILLAVEKDAADTRRTLTSDFNGRKAAPDQGAAFCLRSNSSN